MTLSELNEIEEAVKRREKQRIEKQSITKTKNDTWNPAHVTEYFMKEKFIKIPREKLYPVVSDIKLNDKLDAIRLKTWRNHFLGLFAGKQLKYKVPFAITTNLITMKKTIWIERVE